MNRKVIMATALVSGIATAAQAAIVTWSGASAGPTTNWTDAGNWTSSLAPVATDSLVFDGAVALTNVNDLPAGTQLNGITWAATSGGNWAHSGSSINLAGDLSYARTTGTATTTTPFSLQQNVNIDVAAGGTLNTNGVISGGFAVTKTGSGLSASGVAHTFTGGLNVNGGIFRTTISGNTTASLGTGTVSISNGATVEMRSTTATTFNSALNLGTGGGTIDERSNHTFSPSSITGTGSLTLRPTGATNLVFTLTDMKGWNGTLIGDRNGQTVFNLRLATAFVNNSAANLAVVLNDGVGLNRQNGTNIAPGAVLDLGSLSSTFANSSLGGSAAGTGYFIYSIGGLGTSTSFAGNIVNGGTASALRKVGAGTLTLAGTANTFSGPSSVNEGKLLVNGVLNAAALALTVNSQGTLGGTGSIAGTVTSVGGTIAPGASVGTLTVSNAVSLDAATVLAYELDGSNTAVGGTTNDLLTGVTNLTLDGTLNVSETLALSFAGAADGSKWRLVNYTGTLTDNGLSIGTVPVLPSGGTLSIDTATAGQVNLVLSVPEPTVFGGLGAMTLVLARRRSR